MSWSSLSADCEQVIISFLRPNEAITLGGTCKRLCLRTLFFFRQADPYIFALAQRHSLVLPFVKKLILEGINNLDGIEDVFPGMVDLYLGEPECSVEMTSKVFQNLEKLDVVCVDEERFMSLDAACVPKLKELSLSHIVDLWMIGNFSMITKLELQSMSFDMDLNDAVFPALTTLNLESCSTKINGTSFPAVQYLFSESEDGAGMEVLTGDWPALQKATFLCQSDGPTLRGNFPCLKRLDLIMCFKASLEGYFPNLEYFATEGMYKTWFSPTSGLDIRWRSYDGGKTWSRYTMPISTNWIQYFPQVVSRSDDMDFDDGYW